jgi:hypothetical protein
VRVFLDQVSGAGFGPLVAAIGSACEPVQQSVRNKGCYRTQSMLKFSRLLSRAAVNFDSLSRWPGDWTTLAQTRPVANCCTMKGMLLGGTRSMSTVRLSKVESSQGLLLPSWLPRFTATHSSVVPVPSCFLFSSFLGPEWLLRGVIINGVMSEGSGSHVHNGARPGFWG